MTPPILGGGWRGGVSPKLEAPRLQVVELPILSHLPDRGRRSSLKEATHPAFMRFLRDIPFENVVAYSNKRC